MMWEALHVVCWVLIGAIAGALLLELVLLATCGARYRRRERKRRGPDGGPYRNRPR